MIRSCDFAGLMDVVLTDQLLLVDQSLTTEDIRRSLERALKLLPNENEEPETYLNTGEGSILPKVREKYIFTRPLASERVSAGLAVEIPIPQADGGIGSYTVHGGIPLNSLPCTGCQRKCSNAQVLRCIRTLLAEALEGLAAKIKEKK
jgi:hypothetical protein